MIQLLPATQTALYQHGSHVLAECWTFYLSTGTVRWTSYPVNVTSGGSTWLAGVVGIRKGRISRQAGTGVDTMEAVLAGTVAIGGAPLTQAVMGLAFEGARCVFQKVYFDAPGGIVLEAVTVFDGNVRGMEPGSLETKLTIRSPLARAPNAKGWRVMSTPCPFVVYDAQCGATVQESTATVASGSTATRVRFSASPSTAAIGSRLLFTSGSLSGVAIRVRAVGSGYVDLERPLASAPAAGVKCTVRLGCDHAIAGCRALSNIARFGGALYAPPADLMDSNPEG